MKANRSSRSTPDAVQRGFTRRGFLARAGHAVTLFEASARLGGMQKSPFVGTIAMNKRGMFRDYRRVLLPGPIAGPYCWAGSLSSTGSTRRSLPLSI